MATEIGIIKALVGTATATSTDGTIRNLQVGDKVYQNDLITTGAAGAVEIEFADGSTMDMGRSSQAMLDIEVFDPSTAATETAETTETTDDIAAIQQALLEGEDPTVAGEATAAGAGAGGGSEGGHDFVVREYLNPEVTPENGFDTNGPGAAFLQSEEELNELDDVPTADSVTIQLDEDELTSEQIAELVDSLTSNDEFTAFLSVSLGISDIVIADLFASSTGSNDLLTDLGDDVGPTVQTGTVNADYGFNGPGDIVFNAETNTQAISTTGVPITSGGQPVQYWVSADGKTVIGYVINTTETEEGLVETAQIIFSGQFTDAATGEFTVAIFDQIDHSAPEDGALADENNLLINLDLTISDSDGDELIATIQLDIDDDSPTIGVPDVGAVDEEGYISIDDFQQSPSHSQNVIGEGPGFLPPFLLNAVIGNPGDSYADGQDIEGESLTTSGSLAINWGADNTNQNGSEFDRSVMLLADQPGLDGLTSGGQEVNYTIIDGFLVAFTGALPDFNAETESNFFEQVVFTVSLSDVNNGEYYFNLVRPLDHNDDINNEGDLPLNFNFVATDSDGDSVEGTFTVTVNDDAPVIFGTTEIIHDESAGAQPSEFDGDLANDIFTKLKGDSESPIELVGLAIKPLGGLPIFINPEIGQDQEPPFNDGQNPDLQPIQQGVFYNAGADGLKNVALTNSEGGTFAGVDSGLKTTQGGEKIYLYSASAEMLALLGLNNDGLDMMADNFVIGLTNDAFNPAAPTNGYQSVDAFLSDLAFVVGLLEGDTNASFDDKLALLQLQAIQHQDETNPDDLVSIDELIYLTVTDNDDDSVTSEQPITVTFGDDAPVALDTPRILADEDNLTDGIGNDDSPGDNDQARLFGTLNFNAGADGATVSLAEMDGLAVTGVNGDAVTSNGEGLLYSWNAETNTLTASTTGEPAVDVFTLEITDPETGAYAFELMSNLDHPQGPENVNNTEDPNLRFDLTYTVKDGDGDSVDGSVRVVIDDDIPVFTNDGDITIRHDESAGAQNDTVFDLPELQQFFALLAIAGGADIDPLDLSGDGLELFTTLLGDGNLLGASVQLDTGAITYNAGADGLKNVALTDVNGNTFNGVNSGLQTSNGDQPVYLYSLSGSALAGIGAVLGALGVSFDAEAFGDNIVIGLTDSGFNPETDSLTLDVLADAAFIVGLLEGNAGNGSDDVLGLLQLKALEHTNPNDPDDTVGLDLHISVTDGDGDTITSEGVINVEFDDDAPTINVDAVALAAEFLQATLDETVGEDRAATGEDANGNGDDVDGALAQVTTNVIGGLTTLFVVTGEAGADTPVEDNGTLSLVLSADELATTLDATNGGAITLYQESATSLVGRDENDDDVFTIEIVIVDGQPQLQTTLFEAIEHGNTDSFDEAVALLLESGKVQLQYEVTRTDADGDSVSDSATVDLVTANNSVISFEDDGPIITEFTTNDDAILVLDESVGEDSNDPNANDEANPSAPANAIGFATLSGEALFAATVDAGSDLQDEDTSQYSLTLNFANDADTTVDSGLNTANGDISLSIQGNDVVGSDGVNEVFRISIDSATGAITVVQYQPIDHGELGVDGDAAVSLAEGVLSATFTVADNDGDTVSDSTELGGLISFEDDAPDAEDDMAEVIAGQSVSGNVLDNDEGVDEPLSVVGIKYGEEEFDFANDGQEDGNGRTFIEVEADGGTLQIYQSGHYTFTANAVANSVIEVPNDKLQDWQANVGLFGFDGNAPLDGDDLDLVALQDGAGDVGYANGSKPGLTIDPSKIDADDYLIIELGESATTATVGINQFNDTQTETGQWTAFDAAGNKVAEGTFGGINNNGDFFAIEISSDVPFTYIMFGLDTGATGNAGYVVNSLAYTTAVAEIQDETFTYIVEDQDGSQDEAELTIDVEAAPLNITQGVVNESGLENGSDAGQAGLLETSGYLTIDLQAGDNLTVGGVDASAVIDGDAVMVMGQNGNMTLNYVNGQLTWTYVLDDNSVDHETQGTAIDGVMDDFLVNLNGDDVDTLSVSIVDDVPEAAPFKQEENDGERVEGNIFENNAGEVVGGFGADGGYVQSATVGGVTFSYDGETISFDDLTDAITSANAVDNMLTVETAKGEIITIDFDNGDYTYQAGEQVLVTAEQEVDPEVAVGDNSLLGLIGVSALNLIDFGNKVGFSATDGNNNITSVNVSYSALASFGVGVSNDPLIFSQSLASELGLNVSIQGTWNTVEIFPATPPIIFWGITISPGTPAVFASGGTYTVNITNADGGNIDQLALNEFLASIAVDNNIISADVLGNLSISATDSAGNSDSDTEFNLLDVDLAATLADKGIQVGDMADNTIEGDSGNDRQYGLDGNDLLRGKGGNDLLRGGEGNDDLRGGGGNDILIGGQGNDELRGGSGRDVFLYEAGDMGTPSAPAVDSIVDFDLSALNDGGDAIDLSGLLQGEAAFEGESLNLTNYLHFSQDGNNTVLQISSNGEFTGGNWSEVADQEIIFNGVDLSDLGATDLQIINALLQSGKLVVDGPEAGQSYSVQDFTDVDFVIVDNDGDTTETTVRFDSTGAVVVEGNSPPQVDVTGDGLLGLLGAEALGIVNFGTNQAFKAFDRDNNITRVDLKYNALIGALGGFVFTYSEEAAAAFGLKVEATGDSVLSLPGVISLGDNSGLVITSLDGGNIDNLELNAFLSTVQLEDQNGILDLDISADVLDAVSIEATDAFGLTDSATLKQLAEAEVLDDSQVGLQIVADVDVEGIIEANAEASLVLGGDENDTLIGSDQDDVLFGGDGDDTLIGGQGNDILIGGEGADIFKFNAGDEGTEAEPAVDLVVDFNAEDSDVLDVSDLLNDPSASESLDDYLVANYDSESDQTTIDVYTNGDAQSGSGQSTQSIVVNGDQQDLNALLSNGNLNVDQS